MPPIHATNRPSPDAAIYAVDIDRLKAGMPAWHVPLRRAAAAGTKVPAEQTTRFVRTMSFSRRARWRPGGW
ncbi:MAG TPA: hypothetical protein VHN16_02410 [Streptosporangiaceae bacterium]|nr:hypothetical protein [Streptosporangiaceae bacterium]